MYYNIYEVDTAPITNSIMDALSIGEHSVFIFEAEGRNRLALLA